MARYTVAVPVMNGTFYRSDREKIVRNLESVGAQRVFLALRENSLLSPLREEELAALKENCAFLHAKGFEAGAWLWAFFLRPDRGYTRMESPDGRVSEFTVCPADPDYADAMGGFLEEIAGCGVDLIQFDDDYRYGFQDMGFGCVCPLHRKRMESMLGRRIDGGELKEKLLSGGGNDVRDAFVKANGEALEAFAAAMRARVDKVRPAVRLGFCSCITSWDLDGSCPDRISRLLAGKTRPFYRLIGAPYWAAMNAWGNRLCDVIELERIECSRRGDPEIEIFGEGDTYPRPRHKTPAAYLEFFDTAMRSAGCADGILKYMQDYTADADYETGYYEAARRNADAYEAIDRMFSGKRCVGVRCWDKPDKYRTYSIPERIAGTCTAQELAFSAAARFLAANSVPIVHEGNGVLGAAFGDDVLAVPPQALNGGMILDVSAARLLAERGEDVGISGFGESFGASVETFPGPPGRAAINSAAEAVRLTLSPDAEILSFYETPDSEKLPLSYRYTNAAGRRFLVYAFEGYFAPQDWFRSYSRQRQIESFAAYCGKRLPAFCPGHPELYLLAKKDGERLAVGLWNAFPDPVYAPCVAVDGTYSIAEGFRCDAQIRGGAVTLGDIPPWSFAFFELR